jgi:hypothetical protein
MNLTHRLPLLLLPCVAAMIASASGCSDDDENRASTATDAGPTPTGDGGPGEVGPGGLRRFTAPAEPGPGGVLITVSGEALATEGFPFPPTAGQEVAFVDGWSVSFSRLLATVGTVTLSANPDTDPSDATKTGPVVAEAVGPWAVDLAKDDPSYLSGFGGEGRALALAALESQNKAGGAKFDTSQGTRYAVGFDTVPASTSAFNVNLGPEALEDYAKMVAEGCSVLYVGTASWNGQTCTPAAGADPVLDALPKKVDLRLCFKAPTRYQNCQNPANDPGAPIGSEEHQRGVAFKANAPVVAQLTVHADHPFWNSVEEDSPLVFDPFAAQKSGETGTPTLTLADMAKVDWTAVKDQKGAALPWRNCVGADYTPRPGAMSMLAGTSPNVGASGDPAKGLRHYADYATYLLSTQGHVNGGGLCGVARNYPSPP